MEAIKIEETTHHETFVIRSNFTYGSTAVTTFTMDKRFEDRSERGYGTLRIYGEEGAMTFQFDTEQMNEICRLWQDGAESRTVTELRAAHDALNAECERLRKERDGLKEENAVLIQNQIDATEDIERITEIKCELDDEGVRLGEENDALKRRIRQLQHVCMQAHADIESGHATRSLVALAGMHPYEDDPYGLERLPAKVAEA